MVKNHLLILFIVVQTGITFSQYEYKISTEGFTFDKTTESAKNITINIYLSVKNIGSIHDFNGFIRNIKLVTSDVETNNRIYMTDYKKIIGLNKLNSDYSVISISYLIPKDAKDIKLKLPVEYGGLEIQIYEKSYSEWLKKNEESDESPQKKKGFVEKTVDYTGGILSLDLGYNIKESSASSAAFNIAVIPKIIRFGKDKKYSLGVNLNFSMSFFLNNSFASITDYYGTNNNYTISYGKKDTMFTSTFIGGGPAFTVKFGKVSGLLAINYGLLSQGVSGYNFKDISDNAVYESPSASFGVFKIDIAAAFLNSMVVGYSFVYGTNSKDAPFLNGPYRSHILKIGIGAF